jgi:hypothetical protein
LVGEITVAIGEPIQMLLDISGHPVDVKGVVVRTEKCDAVTDIVAVRFVDVSADSKARISELVRCLLADVQP